MTSSSQDQLAQLQRELARQDADWAETRYQLQQLGDCRLPIPLEILERLDHVAPAPTPTTPRNYLLRA